MTSARLAVVIGLCLAMIATPVAASEPTPAAEAAALLARAAEAGRTVPHQGTVSVVSFSAAGPSIAELDVRVSAGMLELRRPTRWLLGPPTSGLAVRGATGVTRTAGTASRVVPGLQTQLLHQCWDVELGARVELDTGPAREILLRRRAGPATSERLHVDRATGLLVRRETLDPDGRPERVVAFTRLQVGPVPEPGGVVGVAHDDTTGGVRIDPPSLGGWTPPVLLPGGMRLVEVTRGERGTHLRYGDGLSSLSLYVEDGRLDADGLEDAIPRVVAGRDVWTWPGSEPTRVVWGTPGQTFVLVTDAADAVVADVVGVLPDDQHGVLAAVRHRLAGYLAR